MKSYIIGIAGELNSGKDTLASMINYIVAVGTTKANYQVWLTDKTRNDITYLDRITHFADPMKDCLSIMYNIPRKYFDDRKYKDELWYSINERRFITDDTSINHKYRRINIGDFSPAYTLGDAIRYCKIDGVLPVIKLRTLMQYFATEIGRKQMQDNLWINATMGRAANIAEGRKICIIPDVRFINERDAIRGNFLYGGDILIKRDQTKDSEHSSETIDFTCKYEIENNGSKMQLFYKAISVVNDIIKD